MTGLEVYAALATMGMGIAVWRSAVNAADAKWHKAQAKKHKAQVQATADAWGELTAENENLKAEIRAHVRTAELGRSEIARHKALADEARGSLKNLRAAAFLTDEKGHRVRYDNASQAVRERAETGK